MKRYFGAHVSSAGGLKNAVTAAVELGINTIQVHPSPPQRWNTTPFAPGTEDPFNEAREGTCLEKVFFHAIYLINMATPDNVKFQNAKVSLLNYLDYNARIGGSGVIFHVGSMKDQEDDAVGYDRVVSGLNYIMEKAPANGRLILEVAAGAGSVIGDKVEELAMIYDQLERLLKQYPTCWIKYDFSEEMGNCGMWIGRFQRGQPQVQKMEWRELTIEELHHETDFSKSYSSDEV